MISLDTKVISNVLEIMLFQQIKEISEENRRFAANFYGEVVETAFSIYQTWKMVAS